MRTLVYGLGESGVAAIRALLTDGARDGEIVAADVNDTKGLRRVVASLGVEGYLGAGLEALEGADRVVVSPGIRPRDAVLAAAEKRGVPILSEVAMGLEMLRKKGGVRTVAITGTNGKTTVVDMLRRVLETSGVPHAIAGNSWRALTGCLEEALEAGLLLLEVSSFQLHYLKSPGFEIAALLNVQPDHLNWHTSFEEYTEDKLRVFDGQEPRDLALLSASDPIALGAASGLRAEKLVLGEGDSGMHNGFLVLRGRKIAAEEELRFAGAHNHENALFAAACAERLGVPWEGIREGLLGYRLKPHRMEIVAERGGVLYVDDSKATNPAAVAAALGSFQRPVVLILGGSEKEASFGEILPRLDRCRFVVCQGEAGPGISDYLEAAGFGERVRRVPTLSAAVELAQRLSQPGDVVLLSPGCASFDQFTGYAERGEEFARLVVGEGGG